MLSPIGLALSAPALALSGAAASPAVAAPVWRFADQHALGAPAAFLVTAAFEETAKAAVAAARAEIARLNLVFNSRLASSELSKLNRAARRVASPDLFAVLHLAEQMRTLSGGAYNPGLGEVLALWRVQDDAPPSRDALLALAKRAATALTLDPATRTVTRPAGVRLDLDGLAKGYIVDRALAAGLTVEGVHGMLVNIGGDMRSAGSSGGPRGWTAAIPDLRDPHMDAPIEAEVALHDLAIATSGRGMRDRVLDGARYSPTLSPQTGWAADANIAATVTAPTAAQADGLATALLVSSPADGLALVSRLAGVQARILDADGRLHTTPGWNAIANERPQLIRAADIKRASAAKPTNWLPDWVVRIVYSAPPRDVAGRAADYREPYMAMWITDKANKPIRTLVLVGKDESYQRENYIWWAMFKDRARRMVAERAEGTALSGVYPIIWPGYDDNYAFLPRGDYVLHIETSRERGQHTYRSLPLKIGTAAFQSAIPPTAEGGSLTLIYKKRT